MAEAQGDQHDTHFISVESNRLEASLKGCFRCGGTPVETTVLYVDDRDNNVTDVRSFCAPCLKHLIPGVKPAGLHSVKGGKQS